VAPLLSQFSYAEYVNDVSAFKLAVSADENTLYVADMFNGIVILDISNLKNPMYLSCVQINASYS